MKVKPAQMCPVLTEIFLFRATNEQLEWEMAWLPFTGSCSVDVKGNLDFKSDRFVRGYLSKNGRLKSEQEFHKVCAALKSKVGADARRFMRGHDFAELLSIVIRRHLHHDQRNFRDPNVLEGALFCCLEAQRIKDAPLFKVVAARMA